ERKRPPRNVGIAEVEVLLEPVDPVLRPGAIRPVGRHELLDDRPAGKRRIPALDHPLLLEAGDEGADRALREADPDIALPCEVHDVADRLHKGERIVEDRLAGPADMTAVLIVAGSKYFDDLKFPAVLPARMRHP